MILSLIFIFLLLLENLILPALIGPRMFSIVFLFLIAAVAFSPNLRVRLIQVFILLFIAEIFSSTNIGDFLVPFGITILIYMWINRFFSISSGLRESGSFGGIIGGALVITMTFYIYAWFFIFFNSAYSVMLSWIEWRVFVTTSIFPTLGWSTALTLLFKYVLKVK